MSRGLIRGALQRQPPKLPHKPSSQDLGARYLPSNNWRQAASLERRKYRREEAGTFTGLMPPERVACPATPTSDFGVIVHRPGCGHVAYVGETHTGVDAQPPTGGTYRIGDGPLRPAAGIAADRTRSYRPVESHRSYGPRR